MSIHSGNSFFDLRRARQRLDHESSEVSRYLRVYRRFLHSSQRISKIKHEEVINQKNDGGVNGL